jgi:hypothetical protein
MKNHSSILKTDFGEKEIGQEVWLKKREKKGHIYHSVSQCVISLEDMLGYVDDAYQKYLIENEIKKLKKIQKEYYVPSMLKIRDDGVKKSKNLLEKSSFSPVKQLRNQ